MRRCESGGQSVDCPDRSYRPPILFARVVRVVRVVRVDRVAACRPRASPLAGTPPTHATTPRRRAGLALARCAVGQANSLAVARCWPLPDGLAPAYHATKEPATTGNGG